MSKLLVGQSGDCLKAQRHSQPGQQSRSLTAGGPGPANHTSSHSSAGAGESGVEGSLYSAVREIYVWRHAPDNGCCWVQLANSWTHNNCWNQLLFWNNLALNRWCWEVVWSWQSIKQFLSTVTRLCNPINCGAGMPTIYWILILNSNSHQYFVWLNTTGKFLQRKCFLLREVSLCQGQGR